MSGRTNVYNTIKTCEALNTQKNTSATLITSDKAIDKDLLFKKMGVHTPFEVIALYNTDTTHPYIGKKWYEIFTFLRVNFAFTTFILKRRREFDVVYFRDESLFLAALFLRCLSRKKIFFEIHSVYERKIRQIKNVLAVWVSHGIIAISSGLKKHYEKINRNIIVSLCSSYEEAWIDHTKSKSDFRNVLNLPQNKFLIGYIGVIGINPNNDYYEIDDIVRSLVFLPEDVMFIVVGEINGNSTWLKDIAEEINVSKRLMILPWQERSIVPSYLRAFDVNLIPKRKKDLVGDSPAKMFPALAAERPIVAGRAECIEEVLTNNIDSIIIDSNTPEGWAKAIQKVRTDVNLSQKIVNGANMTKNKYTWEKRGEAIAEFIKK